MEICSKFVNLFIGITLIRLCSGFPCGLENSAAGFQKQFLTVLVAVLLVVCGIVFLIGCLCCKRRNGFKEFHNTPVVVSTASLDHGHINPIANSEFTIFMPLSPPHHNNNVFLANEQIVGQTEIDCSHADIDVHSWFDDHEKEFPRTKLKYIKEMGRGWFGRVVEGTAQGLSDHDEHWTPVAVRILEASATSTERAVFLHDAAIYRCGKHPHILKLLGRSLESVPLLLLQELCPCGDLKKYLRNTENIAENLLSSELPLLWSCQITSALKYLHDHRLIHPDFAARNCLVVTENMLKLGDYGLAATLYPEDYYQGAPAVPVRWCAPESLTYTSTTIQPKKITFESNVWSLGVTLWEIFEYGKQPYSNLSDDDVISQVIGSTSVRLAKPTWPVLYSDYIFRLMQLCWSTSESRPSVSQVHLMLSELIQFYNNTSKAHTEPLISLQDFDKHWDRLKPNTIVRMDNHDFVRDSKSLADISDITILSKDEEFSNSKPMSPSMNNLHGSLDNLTNEELDSWLQKVATNTGDMSYVRGLSEAIGDLDNALALENVSSSESSHQPSPAPDEAVKTASKLVFQLGPADTTPSVLSNNKTGNSSPTESMQRTSSESETEDENWRRKVEQGVYSQKVHQKSKSVTDLMVLTHIDYSESDSETPLPSLDYRVNYRNVRYAPKQNLENVSLMFGSEGNLLSVHDKFQNELKRLQEERKDSLLFVPEYSRYNDYDTSKDFDFKLVGSDNTFSCTENQNGECTYLGYNKCISLESKKDLSGSSNTSPSHPSPERLMGELNSTTDIQPSSQVYNVFNLTIDRNFNSNHNSLQKSPVKCFNVPKLTELIENNDDLMDYIINKYDTENDAVVDLTKTANKELNNNVGSTPLEDATKSTQEFLRREKELPDNAAPRVNFDISLTLQTSIPFVTRTLSNTHVMNEARCSLNFDDGDENGEDLKYSLETWDNFLGETMNDTRNCEFDGFVSEPPSILFVDGEDLSSKYDLSSKSVSDNKNVVNETILVREDVESDCNETTSVSNLNNTVVASAEDKDRTFTLIDRGVLNEADQCNAAYDAETAAQKEKWKSGKANEDWFLHPQSNASVSGEMEPSYSKKSYVSFSVNDEIVAALRNELLMKLPHAQGPSNESLEESDDWDSLERNEVLLKYDVYTTPLSPIPEESYSEDNHNFVFHRRISTDSENIDDWPVDSEIVSAVNPESPVQGVLARHTPSQDSCCSNDTLFNLEELANGVNEQDHDKKTEDVHKTINVRSERNHETDINESKTENVVLLNEQEVATGHLLKINDDVVENTNEKVGEPTTNSSASHLNNELLGPGENYLLFKPSNEVDVTRNKLNGDHKNCDRILNVSTDVESKVNGFVSKENLKCQNSVELSYVTLFLDNERQNCSLECELSDKSDLTPVDYINGDDLNNLQLNGDYVNVRELENFLNLNNQCDYVNVSKSINEHDVDIYEALTDIHFSGPSDMQLMSTSFSESVDIDEQDWDSGSDTRSSSSGEFIWKEGEHEESVKALRAAPQDMNSKEKCDTMDDIDEVCSESSDGDEDVDSPEFIPSAWDMYATPTKSSLRSPEKSLEKAEIKSKKQKGVWFKKQKYHCVYEYPREPESPIVNSYDLWQPISTSIIDWEVDTSPYIPSLDPNNSQMDLDKRNVYLGDFSTGLVGFDDEFYISGTAQPFEAYSGFASQFFPGNNVSDQWLDFKPYENITPDSGVEDITPASSSDCNEYQHEIRSQVQSLKSLAGAVLKRTEINNLKNTAIQSLGGLRHARNKLKLDLPPSPSAFTVSKIFTVEPEEEPITKQEVPTFATFGKSRFLVQHVDTPTPDEDNCKNVSFEALPYKPLYTVKDDKAKVEARGEASLLDSADEDSGIESSTLERRKIITAVHD